MENLYFKFTKIAAAMLHKLRNFIIEGCDLTVGWANKDLRLFNLSPSLGNSKRLQGTSNVP